MANYKRKEKELPIHQRYAPALPADEDPEGGLLRLGIIDQREFHPVTDDPEVMGLLKKALGTDQDITLHDLRALAEGRKPAPPSPALEAELDWREKRHQSLMDELQRGFELDGNPLFAWDAFQLCRRDKRPIPVWVQEYFDATVWRITQTGNKPADLPEYLGFRNKKTISGGSQFFKQYKDLVVRREATAYVKNFLRDNKGKRKPDGRPYTIEDGGIFASSKMAGRLGFKSKDPVELILGWYKDEPDVITTL